MGVAYPSRSNDMIDSRSFRVYIASSPGPFFEGRRRKGLVHTVCVVSQASPFTREEGSGQLRIMSLCCRVSSGQAVQGVSSNSMLFAVVSRDAVLAELFGARHTEYACARLVCVHSTSYYTSMRVICG